MTRFRSPVFAFAPYLALSVVHLVLLYIGPAWSVTATKAMLMPLLALAVVLCVRPVGSRDRRAPASLLLAAIALSWGGDVLLSFPGDGWFAAGLVSFLLAHVAYIVLFLRMPRVRRHPPAWSYAYWAWMIVVLGLLLPHAGSLAVPLVLYAAAIGMMAVCASLHTRWIALGGAFFIASDSVLALGRFLPGYEFVAHDFVVMSTYLAAQGLIAWGAVAAIRAGRAVSDPSSPALDRRAGATAP
ncbi:lysoplasmalogenase [Agromyces laixinhei]|uniref:lysoplasmalogenase n=1 Tax=Agromyces laixinhei TaxID=2585717 RepID=UPI00143DAEEE|nr:lysoplasmalogenase [Agromyces laixinhei]